MREKSPQNSPEAWFRYQAGGSGALAAYGGRAFSEHYCHTVLQAALEEVGRLGSKKAYNLYCKCLYSFTPGMVSRDSASQLGELLHLDFFTSEPSANRQTVKSKQESEPQLGALLHPHASKPESMTEGKTVEFWVAPRIGRISPWSSKVADILRSCGMGDLVSELYHLELLYSWRLETYWGNETNELAKAIQSIVCDPMRETVLHPRRERPRPGAEKKLRTGAWGYQSSRAFDGDQEASARVLASMREQVNSEHCRHWIFNASWQSKQFSLFELIKKTSKGEGEEWKPELLSCYTDNAAVFTGPAQKLWMPDHSAKNKNWQWKNGPLHSVLKAETHNHPTGISPWPGAATGVGGEIRDEAAAGRGARSRVGVAGYITSDPHWRQHWLENAEGPTVASSVNYPTLSDSHGDDQIEALPALSPPRAHFAGPRQILIEAPLGAAAFANEFGRPNLAGFVRTMEVADVAGDGIPRGYDKPVMLAGGLGQICDGQQQKSAVGAGVPLYLLGGPAMRVGIGGSAVSSRGAGSSGSKIEFASVQRDNAEMQRRCQEVLDACWSLKEGNPILFIHDLGAGGLANAVPELLKDCGVGGAINLRAQAILETMTLAEVWCNESQERFLLAVHPDKKEAFEALCQRENCPVAALGETIKEPKLSISAGANLSVAETILKPDPLLQVNVNDIFEQRQEVFKYIEPSDSTEHADSTEELISAWAASGSAKSIPKRLAGELLAWPAVGSKAFAIQIGDRTVGGLTARDQMVGANQIPVADCAVISSSMHRNDYSGTALAMGEKAPLALLDVRAASRMAATEALLGLVAAGVCDTGQVRFSANWMADCGEKDDAERNSPLYWAVQALSDFCCKLNIAVPVGKDSLSMRSKAWQNKGAWVPERQDGPAEVSSPVTLAITACAGLKDVRKVLTPALVPDANSRLIYIDLSGGKRRLGASTWQQIDEKLSRCRETYRPGFLQLLEPNQTQGRGVCGAVPDVEPQTVRKFVKTVGQMVLADELLAYHDISDGGLFACAFEMALAGGCGIALDTQQTGWDAGLFCEEAGVLLQVSEQKLEAVMHELEEAGLSAAVVAMPLSEPLLTLGDGFESEQTFAMTAAGTQLANCRAKQFPERKFAHLAKAWTHHSDRVRKARQDESVDIEAGAYGTAGQRLAPSESSQMWPVTQVRAKTQHQVAILREQGVNGQAEMAAAFDRAGLQPVDVHMTDLLAGRVRLDDFSGLAFCGGFSYGDTLGAGRGWGMRILKRPKLKEQFENFFDEVEQKKRFVLGVCNGCQTLSVIREIIPGAKNWPDFEANTSGRFEARLVQVQIAELAAVKSPLLRGMGGQRLLIPVSHGEGRVANAGRSAVAARYVSRHEEDGIAELYVSIHEEKKYPLNPNGSKRGIAAVQAAGGHVLAMMPHPERVFRTVQLSWAPDSWKYDVKGQWREDSPWMQLFYNAADLVARGK